MISGAAFCPHPPLLVPAVASGAAGELERLRAACAGAVRRVLRPGVQPVLIGAGNRSLSFSAGARGSLAPYGVQVEVHLGSPRGAGAPDLPLSLTVGAWLLQSVAGPHGEPAAFSVGEDFSSSSASAELLALVEAADEGSADIALIVMGDGSARRSKTAPGYLDERAGLFDAAVAQALSTADARSLAALDLELGDELLAAGTPAWRAAAAALNGRSYDAELLYDDAPYGVGYLVAAWTGRGSAHG